MRKNPIRTAWIILLTAFAIFCVLAVTIPASVYWYVTTATTPFNTEVTSVRGTVLTQAPGQPLPAPIMDGKTVAVGESFSLSTNDTSQSILTFFDDSSLTMYSNTDITLHQTRMPRFPFFSANPPAILLEVERGRVRATTSRSRHDLAFDFQTPHATIQLDRGSFSIEVEQETQITARFGQAAILGSQGSPITLNEGERVVIGAAGQISPPLPAAQNLLQNSSFTPPLQKGWEEYAFNFIQGITTTTEVITYQNRSVLRLRSAGQDNSHTEIGVTQQVNKDVRDFRSLRIFAEVWLTRQSLPGGGQLGSEFPVMLHVAYKDAENNDRDWFHGFYYRPAPENYILYNQPDHSSDRIAPFIWYPYESANLLTTLGPAKPVFIKSVRIYASGWLYDSMVANISLLAEE
jgi:hypothetical protein